MLYILGARKFLKSVTNTPLDHNPLLSITVSQVSPG